MTDWNYGDAYLRHPLPAGRRAVFSDGSTVKVHNVFDPLPDFMRAADVICVDPPWNLGNLNSFYTKADRRDHQDTFETFYRRLFECIGEIHPTTCYVEIGKEYLADFVQQMRRLYPHVTFYNSSYYHKRDNICYVIRGARKRRKLPLDYMDEEDIIAWICKNEEYACIGDLCMGRGLVGLNAFKNGRPFVGTELNHKRLSVLLDNLAGLGASYELISDI